jgi:hypothetical protein
LSKARAAEYELKIAAATRILLAKRIVVLPANAAALVQQQDVICSTIWRFPCAPIFAPLWPGGLGRTRCILADWQKRSVNAVTAL